MNFNTRVEKEVVDAILESSLWKKAKVDVQPRTVNESSENEGDIGTIPEYENGVVNEYEEMTDVEDYVPGEEQQKFTLDDLQCVLDNLEDEDLMEHAMSMLDVFDVAYEQLNEGDEDEEEEDEDEEEEGALEEGKAARGKSKKKSSGLGHGGGRRLRTGRASGLPKGTSRAKRQDVADRQNIGKRYQHELSDEEKAEARGRQQDKDYEHGTGRYA